MMGKSFRFKWIGAAAALAVTAASMTHASAAELRFGMADDPDALDSITNRTTSGTQVLTALCDRLLTINADGSVTPDMAKSWAWSEDKLTLTLELTPGLKFHDGTDVDAEAVKFHIERAKTQKDSQRAEDATSVISVEAKGPTTVVVKLSQPDAVLLTKLGERLGMVMSPTAVKAGGENFARNPVCTGPYKFVSRAAQDKIVLEKYANHRNASAYAFDRVTFKILPDDSVRLANVRAGSVDLIERLDPSAVASVEQEATLKVIPIDTFNNQTVVINFDAKNKPPLSTNTKVREAFELALDRQAIVDVVWAGRYVAGNQFVPPSSPYYNKDIPIPARDVTKAKKILQEQGFTQPVRVELMASNRPLSVRVVEVMQAMLAEAGFDAKIKVVEHATALKVTAAGDFETWSPIGPQFANDPDALSFLTLHSTGGRNLSRYNNPEVDKLLLASRAELDPAKRAEVFHKIMALVTADRPVIYLYHLRPLYAVSAKLSGFKTTVDGFILFHGMKLN